MGLVHFIGPRERVWFRRCRRAWDLGSPNRQNFEPQDASSTALDLEAAARKALAVWYFPGMWEWPRAVVLPRALQAFDEVVARGQFQGEAAGRTRAMLERYFAWAPTVDAFAPVRVENDFEANIPDVRTPGQALVDGDGRPVRYIDRVPLLIVDAADTYWIMEHRLVDDGWADREELLLAERPVAAAWGWEQFYLGMAIAGTVHNELRLTGEGRPDEEPGPGKPARHPRSRDWARSRAAGRDPATAGQTAGSSVLQAGPADAVVQEDGGWFRRTWIRRTRAEIDGVGERLSAEVLDMLDAGLALYPSPSPEHCGPLPLPGPLPGHERGNRRRGGPRRRLPGARSRPAPRGPAGWGDLVDESGRRPTPELAKAAKLTGKRPSLGVIDDVRCPSCSRPLVLRSGPAITAHFAHRPRQSCRNRPGRAPITTLRLEQLTLFELEPLPPASIPVFYWNPRPARPPAPPARPVSRRRRRAWLPRLIRWVKARAAAG